MCRLISQLHNLCFWAEIQYFDGVTREACPPE